MELGCDTAMVEDDLPHFRTQFGNGKLWRVRWFPSGGRSSRFITGTYGGKQNEVAVWSVLEDSESHDAFKHESGINFDADIRDLLIIDRNHCGIALNDGSVSVVEAGRSTLSVKSTLECPRRGVAAHALCGDDEKVVVGYSDGSLSLKDLRAGSSSKWLVSELSSVQSLAMMTPNIMASAHMNGSVHVWDVRQKPNSAGIPQPAFSCVVTQLCDAVTSVGNHPADTNMLGFGTSNGVAGLLDTRMNESQIDPNALPLAAGPVWEVAFHPDYPRNFYGAWNHGYLLHFEIGAVGMFEALAESSEPTSAEARVAPFSRLSEARVTELLDGYVPINTFDVSSRGLLVGADNCILTLIDRKYFS